MGWLAVGTTSASHVWSTGGAKSITAQARSATNNSIVSSVSSALLAGMQAPETLLAPNTPMGPAWGYAGTTYTYSTGGAGDSIIGNPIQYQFNWGDGTSSGWLPQTRPRPVIPGQPAEITPSRRPLSQPLPA